MSKSRSSTTTDSTTTTTDSRATESTPAPSENPAPSPTLSDDYVSLLKEKCWTVQELVTVCPTADVIARTVHIARHLWAAVASSSLPAVDSGDVSFVPPTYADVYLSHKPAENIAPVVIDTGASLSLSPYASNFVDRLQPPPISSLNGLQHKTLVVGYGTVKFTIVDMNGTVITIRAKAFYVPDAAIRLYSLQTHFREDKAGCESLLITAQTAQLTLPEDGTKLVLSLIHISEPTRPY